MKANSHFLQFYYRLASSWQVPADKKASAMQTTGQPTQSQRGPLFSSLYLLSCIPDTTHQPVQPKSKIWLIVAAIASIPGHR